MALEYQRWPITRASLKQLELWTGHILDSPTQLAIFANWHCSLIFIITRNANRFLNYQVLSEQ